MFFFVAVAQFSKSPRRGGAEAQVIYIKETRHVEIFTALGRSSRTSLSEALSFLVGIAKNWGRMAGGVRVSLPPEGLLWNFCSPAGGEEQGKGYLGSEGLGREQKHRRGLAHLYLVLEWADFLVFQTGLPQRTEGTEGRRPGGGQ